MYVTKQYENYDLTLDLKTYGHILFDMPSSKFCPDFIDLRYFRYIGSKVEKKRLFCNIKPSCC